MTARWSDDSYAPEQSERDWWANPPHVALSGNHFFVALGAAAVARETTPNARVIGGDKAPIGCDRERDWSSLRHDLPPR